MRITTNGMNGRCEEIFEGMNVKQGRMITRGEWRAAVNA